MKKNINGFTLIEIMVVISIFAIIAVVGGNLFFSILKGATKSKTMESVKQNGNYALAAMERNIRNARKIVNSDYNFLEIDNPDGGTTTRFSCEDLDADNNFEIASNSSRLISSEVKVYPDCAGVFNVIKGEAGASPDVVVISFELTQANASLRPEEQSTVNFKTTVTLRNY